MRKKNRKKGYLEKFYLNFRTHVNVLRKFAMKKFVLLITW